IFKNGNTLDMNIEERTNIFEELVNYSKDIITLKFKVAGVNARAFYIDGITDKAEVEINVLEPLKTMDKVDKPIISMLQNCIYISSPIVEEESIVDFAEKVVSGDVGLMFENDGNYFVISARSYQMRAVQEPPVSTVLSGPREGFNEDMKINMTLLRRKLRTRNLVFEQTKVGRYTSTSIAIAYIKGIAEDRIIKKIKDRIAEIDIDGVIDSSYIAKFLEERPASIFPQVGKVEKPDIVAAKLLEGRIAIIVDGTPVVLTLPFVLMEHFQGSQDYMQKSARTTLVRLVRICSQIFALILPGMYVAILEFQYQMFPMKFVLNIMKSIASTPLTPAVEMLFVLLIFEILSDASLRMPRYLSMALSILGAIILGDTAVKAGLLSSPTVLVVSISTIGMYCVPNQVEASSIIRILFVVVAAIFGLFGVIMLGVFLLAYLSTIKSYETSYLAPLAPMLTEDFKDTMIKEDLTKMTNRPKSIPNINSKRQGDNDK
ncbi:MAG: spore germination protein, partial [Clostridia bacterium]